MLRSHRLGRALCAAATVACTLAFMALPAGATSATSADTYLTLFSDTAMKRPVTTVNYDTCDHFIGTVPGFTVGSFDNHPPAGCEVVLHSSAGDWHLCVGRGTIAPEFRRVFLYTIHEGQSAPCRDPRL